MKNFYEYIDDYVNDNLNESDRTAFEAQMSNDSGLKQAVDDFDVVEMVLDGLLEDEIRNVVENDVSAKVISMQSNTGQKQLKASSLKPIKFLMAMAAILLAVLVYTNLVPSIPVQANFADVYVETPVLSGDRSSDEDKDKYETAIDKYKEENKELSISLLEKMNSPKADYYLLEIYFKEQQFGKVLALLPRVESPAFLSRDRLNYIKITSNYYIGNKEKAIALIKQLPSDTDAFYLNKYKHLQ